MDGKRLKKARENKKISQMRLAELVNVTGNTVYRWEKNIVEPTDETKKNIAELLNVSVSYLMGEDELSPVSPPAQPDPPHGLPDELIRIPVLADTATACCGYGAEMTDEAQPEEWIYALKSDIGAIDSERPPFAIKADGDSMDAAGIHYGTRLIINPTREPVRGDVIVFDYYGRRLVRYYMPNAQGADMTPANEKYPTLRLTAEDMSPDLGNYRFIGVVCELVSTPRRCE